MMEEGTSIPVIALLGGVGSGKTTAAELFEQLGCVRIDADAIAHRVLDVSDVQSELRSRWGSDIFAEDGSVSRGALAARVFARPEDLDALNAIVHPRVRLDMIDAIAQARREGKCRAVVVDAPVLLEAGCQDLCSHLVFVESPAGARAERVRAQRGWDENTWRAREKSQKELDTKAQLCDHRLVNSSSVSHLAEQIRKLLNCIVVDSS